jgi:hypothetical protein
MFVPEQLVVAELHPGAVPKVSQRSLAWGSPWGSVERMLLVEQMA